MLKRFFLPGQRHCPHPSLAVFFLTVALFSEAVDASDLIRADCDTALNDQQLALGDFIFAQRAGQDVREREGRSRDIVQLAQSACE